MQNVDFSDWKECWLICIRSMPDVMHQIIRQDPHTVTNPAGKRVWSDDMIVWKQRITPHEAALGINRLLEMRKQGFRLGLGEGL